MTDLTYYTDRITDIFEMRDDLPPGEAGAQIKALGKQAAANGLGPALEGWLAAELDRRQAGIIKEQHDLDEFEADTERLTSLMHLMEIETTGELWEKVPESRPVIRRLVAKLQRDER